MQAYIRPFDFVSGQVILPSTGEISMGIAVGRSTAVVTYYEANSWHGFPSKSKRTAIVGTIDLLSQKFTAVLQLGTQSRYKQVAMHVSASARCESDRDPRTILIWHVWYGERHSKTSLKQESSIKSTTQFSLDHTDRVFIPQHWCKVAIYYLLASKYLAFSFLCLSFVEI
jgi:hypothetical protein